MNTLGTERIYDLSAVLEFGTDDQQADRQEVHGTWSETPVATQGARTVVHTELRDSATVADCRFFIHRAASGRVEAVTFPDPTGAEARGLITGLVTGMQLVRPAEASPQWDARETDDNGMYTARYLADGHTVAKERLAYVAATGVEAGGDVWFSLDADEQVSTSRGNLWMTANEGAAAMSATLSWPMQRAATASRPELVEQFAANRDRLAHKAPAAAAPHRPLDALVTELTDATRLSDAHAVRSAVAADLGAALETRPALVEAVVETVLSGVDTPVAETLVAALATADTTASQQALSALAIADIEDVVRSAATLSLGLTHRPTAETADTLGLLLDDPTADVASTAALALGSISEHLDSDDTDSLDGVQILMARYGQATAETDKALYLTALGNTADPRILPAVQDALTSASSLLRSVAVEAVRLIADPAADKVIAAALATDPADEVRRSARFAAAHRLPN